MHDVLTRYYRGQDAFKWLARSAKANRWQSDPDLQALYVIVEGNLTEYVRFWHPQEEGITVESVEEGFEVPIPDHPDAVLNGFWDAIWLDSRGDRWLVEHKTGKQEITADLRYFDLQSALYQWAWYQKHPDRPIKGTVWNYITSATLAPPKMLARGGPSRSANQRTTWPLYYDVILQSGKDPDLYEDMKELFENKIHDYFHRVVLPVDDRIVSTFVDELIVSLDSINAARTDPDFVFVRNVGRQCGWCDYSAICQNELITGEWEDDVYPDYEVEEKGGRKGKPQFKNPPKR